MRSTSRQVCAACHGAGVVDPRDYYTRAIDLFEKRVAELELAGPGRRSLTFDEIRSVYEEISSALRIVSARACESCCGLGYTCPIGQV